MVTLLPLNTDIYRAIPLLNIQEPPRKASEISYNPKGAANNGRCHFKGQKVFYGCLQFAGLDPDQITPSTACIESNKILMDDNTPNILNLAFTVGRWNIYGQIPIFFIPDFEEKSTFTQVAAQLKKIANQIPENDLSFYHYLSSLFSIKDETEELYSKTARLANELAYQKGLSLVYPSVRMEHNTYNIAIPYYVVDSYLRLQLAIRVEFLKVKKHNFQDVTSTVPPEGINDKLWFWGERPNPILEEYKRVLRLDPKTVVDNQPRIPPEPLFRMLN